MKATVLDTATGEIKVIDGPRSWEWAENNYSCDCNRYDGDKINTGKPEGYCEGAHRFIMIDAEMNDPDDYPYTLRELNDDYPDELLAKHISADKLDEIIDKRKEADDEGSD